MTPEPEVEEETLEPVVLEVQDVVVTTEAELGDG